MKLKEILKVIEAEPFYLHKQNELENEFNYISATDLMSDALAMVCAKSTETILLTGLANTQSIRTAEMLDITNIIFVRSKIPAEDVVALAKESGCNLFMCTLSMYEACGELYSLGLRTATK